jgi:formylglycine-generating enzyme required for sulfatase activity/serine/threonine protein kinase
LSAQQIQVQEALEELRSSADSRRRYSIEGELGKGGMGAVLRVEDRTLARPLAMKVIRGQVEETRGVRTPPIAPRQLQRFLDEARITAQLDHPGIVPVHELGVDAEGRAYFTMKLVQGRTLAEVLRLQASGDPEWTRPRVLALIQRVCEAMAFAHERGVIHRDLKPANVMVGDFGEVYVMDWGLARRAAERAEDLTLASEDAPAEPDPLQDELTRTRAGAVLGTPAYMSPEQASGDIQRMGPHSDVYSIGALLYQLLAGHAPYCEPGRDASSTAVILRIVQGPPKPLDGEGTPADLLAICEKAMRREASERYQDVRALSADLEAFLTGRVVRAYEAGAWPEAKKWIRRNKALATASAAGIVALVAGLATSSGLYVYARENEHEASQERDRADREAQTAKARTLEVLRLSAMSKLEDLISEAKGSWPAVPASVEGYEDWMRRAEALVAELPEHEKTLTELRSRAGPVTAGPEGPGAEELVNLEGNRWWSVQLEKLVEALKAFADPEAGLLSPGISAEHGWGMPRRLEFARTVEERSLRGPSGSQGWTDAVASIADPARCPPYAGLRIQPQLGLLPIGRDPDSGLWEFAELQTGEPARRGAGGKLVLGEETGLVLVLLPGGTFRMGAQAKDQAEVNYDPLADLDESPVHDVTLAPFFLSKYEMTQGQWLRFTGRNPSFNAPGTETGYSSSLLHPVEQVSWLECAEVLAHLGLALPTEAQWEYAARAGTTTPWWSGDEPRSLAGVANLADAFAQEHGGPPTWSYETALNDGFALDAPVGQFRANLFGLHDVHGNLWEWCRDAHAGYRVPARPGDGEREDSSKADRVLRGGAFNYPPTDARSAVRRTSTPDATDFTLGLRPARSVVH